MRGVGIVTGFPRLVSVLWRSIIDGSLLLLDEIRRLSLRTWVTMLILGTLIVLLPFLIP